MTYEWRPVHGFPGYEISKLGEVRSLARRNLQGALRRERILKVDVTGEGYAVVRLARDGVKHARAVHRLVLEAFVGPCPEGMECRHLNGIRLDNRSGNLRWGTIQENRADQRLHGTSIDGTRNPAAKVNETDVERMFDLRRAGCSQQAIADWIGLHQTQVSRILRGRHWTQQHVA